MKKLIFVFIVIAVIGALTAGLFTMLSPLITDEISGAIDDLLSGGTPTTTEPPLPDGTVTIPYRVYFQDPESGEYQLTTDKNEYLLEGRDKRFDPPTVEYYLLNEEKSRYEITSAKEGDFVTLYYDCETCKVIFNTENADILDGYTIQTLRKGQIPKAPTLSLKGYTMTGYDKPLDKVYEDTVYTPHWEITKYVLRLHATEDTELDSDAFTHSDGSDGCFEAFYTFEDALTVPTPRSDGYTFLEWNTSPDGKGDKVTEITAGTYENTTLYAIYTVKLYSITFTSVEGVSYPAYYLPYGTPISAPAIAPEHQKAGQGLTWYSDSTCQQVYDFRVMPKENITLWGKWESDTDTGFLSWDPDKISDNTIDSFSELVDFIDFVRFYNYTESVRVEVTYTGSEALKKDIAKAELLEEFRANGSISYSVSTNNLKKSGAKCALSLRVSNSYRDTEAKKTTESSGISSYPLITPPITPRGDDYSVFYIDKLPNTYPVSTSNQLLYVVEHGYRPICEKGSSAEKIYLLARELLNSILPKDATQLEKAELIYQYLVTEIEYDNNAVKIGNASPDTWPEYDAYFLEGVFYHQKAVCDGIAKSFSLLCNIEGIPAVEVIGENHAWNRVKINNRWYVADPTFGNLNISGSDRAIADHSQFLISDEEKTAAGYPAFNYLEIKAEKNYGYFEWKDITYNSRSFDYIIDSTEELARFLEYLASFKIDLSEKTVNIVYNIKGLDLHTAYEAALRTLAFRGVSFRYNISYYGEGQSSITHKLIFKKK